MKSTADEIQFREVRQGVISSVPDNLQALTTTGFLNSRRSTAFIAFLPPLALVLWAVVYVERLGWERQWRGALVDVFCVYVAGLVWLLGRVALRKIGRLIQKWLDEKQFEPSAQDLHVSVAYTEDLVSLKGSDSWDRGYLSLNDGILDLRGYGSRFAMPVSAITGMYIGQAEGIYGRSDPRLYIVWKRPDDDESTLSIEVLETKDKRESLEHLAEALRGTQANDDIEPQWPVLSPSFSAIDFFPRIKKEDRKPAVAICASSPLLFLLVGLGLDSLVKHHTEAHTYALWTMIFLSWYSAAVRFRVNSRMEEEKLQQRFGRKDYQPPASKLGP